MFLLLLEGFAIFTLPCLASLQQELSFVVEGFEDDSGFHALALAESSGR